MTAVIVQRRADGNLEVLAAPEIAHFDYDLVFASDLVDLEVNQLRIPGTPLVYAVIRQDDDRRVVTGRRIDHAPVPA